MARKKVDPAAAKAAKQKKTAIILSCVLLAMMAFSIPISIKKMKQLNGPPPAEAAPAAAPVPTDTPAPAVTPAPGVDPAAAGAEQLASAQTDPTLADAPELEPGEGQLIAFDRFVSKDPFIPQVGADDAAAGAGATGAAGPTPSPGSTGGIVPGGVTGVEGPLPPSASDPGTVPGVGTTGATGATGAGGFDPQTAPTAPAAPLPTTATISVNGGAAEAVIAAGTFPTVQPIFRLVSLTRNGAKIGIVDGNYESGDPTIDLTVGKPVTLMNTSDGQRYEILLVSLS